MLMSETIALQPRKCAALPSIDALRAPAYALGATMAGFATIAREAGFDVWMAVTTSALVWGMPGQVVFASLIQQVHRSLLFLSRYSCQYADATDGRISCRYDASSHDKIATMAADNIDAMSCDHKLGASGSRETIYPRHLLLPYFQGFSLTLFASAHVGYRFWLFSA